MLPLQWCAAAILLQAASQTDGSKEIKIDSEIPVYTVTLPAGYEPTTPREAPLRYSRSYGREMWYRVSVSFANASGPIKQNPSGITAAEVLPFVTLPPDATRTFMTLKWKNLDIGVMEYRAVLKDIPVIGMCAVLPLQGNAMTMTVYGPTSLEKEMRDEFREILPRIARTATNWYTAEEFKKMQTLDTVGKVGAGLLVLYPIAWATLFRGSPMRAHWVRVVWLLAIAVLLFLPVTSPGPTTLINNLVVNAVFPLVMLSFVVRRIKLSIDEE
jgi:hypothetical protein